MTEVWFKKVSFASQGKWPTVSGLVSAAKENTFWLPFFSRVMMHGARSVTAAVAAAACEGCSNACGCLNHVICCMFCSILARHLLHLSIYSFTSMSAASVPSPAIKITNLRRPFTEKALRSLLAEFGSFDFFWFSRIKDVCLLQYDSLASAARALPELNGRTWPEHGAPARTQRPCIHSIACVLCL